LAGSGLKPGSFIQVVVAVGGKNCLLDDIEGMIVPS